jgi:histidyl-tRNA synthetase
VRLEINSLGQADERAQHRTALIAYFEQNASALDADSQRRLKTNPLRILDSKNPEMQALIEGAPRLLDFLGPESLAHFEAVQDLLKANNVPCKINPRLVRGLDYYTRTAFELSSPDLGSQDALGGGGRYDLLIEELGGWAAAVGLEGWARPFFHGSIDRTTTASSRFELSVATAELNGHTVLALAADTAAEAEGMDSASIDVHFGYHTNLKKTKLGTAKECPATAGEHVKCKECLRCFGL